MTEPIHLLSLGAGVQSSTMALMAAHGEITPMPLAAIFADTQAEPPSVYRWLDWLERQLPFPVHRVTAGDLAAEATKMRVSKKGRKYSKTAIPFFTLSAKGEQGRVMHRTCTRDFKIIPLMKLARKLAGVKRGQKTVGVIQWIGISMDEIMRCKPAREPWAQTRWPLIELRMTRAKCLDWMQRHGYPQPPRSACVFCPFHSLGEWRRLKDEEPEEFERAVQVERAVQLRKDESDNFSSTPFLHRSCKPLDQVDLRTDEEKGQSTFDWQDDCEGMCGV